MSELSVLAVGASTPLGLDARQSSLLLRAGKGQPRPSPFVAEDGNTIGTIRCQRLDDGMIGYDRFVALGRPALREAMVGDERPGDRSTVLLLGLPEPYEGDDPRLSAELLHDLSRHCQLSLDPRSAVVRIGNAGFAALLARAAMFSAEARVIVGAIDSYHDPARMQRLDRNYRIHGPRSGNGFIPSEAAAFARVAAARGKGALAAIKFVACAEEPDEEPALARALTRLLRDERLPSPVPWVLSDDNGENHRIKEWTFATIRNAARFEPGRTRVQRPHGELGDVGAASGAVYLAHACMGFKLGFAPASSALVVTSSEGAERGIFFVEPRA